MEAEDEIFLIGGDVASLEGRAEVVHPPQAAAFAAALKASPLGKSPPSSFSFLLHKISQNLIFLRRPRPSLYPHLATTWRDLPFHSWTPHLNNSLLSFSLYIYVYAYICVCVCVWVMTSDSE